MSSSTGGPGFLSSGGSSTLRAMHSLPDGDIEVAVLAGRVGSEHEQLIKLKIDDHVGGYRRGYAAALQPHVADVVVDRRRWNIPARSSAVLPVLFAYWASDYQFAAGAAHHPGADVAAGRARPGGDDGRSPPAFAILGGLAAAEKYT